MSSSVLAEPHRAPAPPHMEHGVPSMDPYINGGAPNGLPYHPVQEAYQPAAVAAPSHNYPPTPVAAYPQPTAYPGPSTYGVTRRKQVRAQQVRSAFSFARVQFSTLMLVPGMQQLSAEEAKVRRSTALCLLQAGAVGVRVQRSSTPKVSHSQPPFWSPAS